MNASFWIKSATNVARYPPLGAQHMACDVAVIGGGIVGLSAALRLKEEGKRVVVVEAGKVGTGTTGNSTAKLTSLHRLVYADLIKTFGTEGASKYASLNQAGIDLVQRWVNEHKIDCEFQRKPNYTVAQEESSVGLVREEVAAACAAGLRASFVTSTDLPLPVKGAIRVEDQAQFNPFSYCHGLAQRINDGRSVVFEDTRVVDISMTSPHKVSVEAGGYLNAEYVIVATHLPILDRSGHFAVVKPERSYSCAYTLTPPAKPPQDMYITVEKQPTLSIRSASNGNVLIFGGMGHSVGEELDTELMYTQLDGYARKYFPVQELICRWSSQDFMPPDMLPYIGHLHRGTSTMFTATGFKKWGLAAGSASALIFADLIEKRHNQWVSLMDATRWDVRHSVVNMVKYQANVGAHFVGDRIKHYMHLKDVEDLACGHGAICKAAGQTVAAYRDEKGEVHAVSPVCKHLGCHVNWNQAEKSWDCPCHGSRYDVDGRILEGPTVAPLPKISISKEE